VGLIVTAIRRNGRPPIGLERMLRIYFLQKEGSCVLPQQAAIPDLFHPLPQKISCGIHL